MFMCNKRVSDWQDNVLQRGCSVPFLRTWLLNLAVIESQLHPISKQKSLPPFVFLEAIRHIRHFFIDKVFKETLCIP